MTSAMLMSKSFQDTSHTPTTEEIGEALLNAAITGNVRKLKKLVETGIHVDYRSQSGHTALFAAALESRGSAVEYLLKKGANPNQRGYDGRTPVHGAAQCGSIRILNRLVDAGGDLRLHDSQGRSARDWAASLPESRKRKKILKYLDKKKATALNSSGKDFMEMSLQRSNASARFASLGHMMKYGTTKSILRASSVHNHGFGKVCIGTGDYVGMTGSIPLVPESLLTHDPLGYSYDNGPFMIMESMYWNKVKVTVKRLHREPRPGGHVDMLITESDYMSRLHHPSVLLLMGTCQTEELEGLVLIYERVACGSLYSYIHQRMESLDMFQMCCILRQVADALLYLHQQNLIHCAVTSHAVQLVAPNSARLGNFEYMVENVSLDGVTPPYSYVLSNTYCNAVYNWLAPEILAGQPPTERSDLYSYCAIVWELLNESPPWAHMGANEIHREIVENGQGLDLTGPHTSTDPFNMILQYGLSRCPNDRHLSLEQTRDILAEHIMDQELTSPNTNRFSPGALRRSACDRMISAAMIDATSHQSHFLANSLRANAAENSQHSYQHQQWLADIQLPPDPDHFTTAAHHLDTAPVYRSSPERVPTVSPVYPTSGIESQHSPRLSQEETIVKPTNKQLNAVVELDSTFDVHGDKNHHSTPKDATTLKMAAERHEADKISHSTPTGSEPLRSSKSLGYEFIRNPAKKAFFEGPDSSVMRSGGQGSSVVSAAGVKQQVVFDETEEDTLNEGEIVDIERTLTRGGSPARPPSRPASRPHSISPSRQHQTSSRPPSREAKPAERHKSSSPSGNRTISTSNPFAVQLQKETEEFLHMARSKSEKPAVRTFPCHSIMYRSEEGMLSRPCGGGNVNGSGHHSPRWLRQTTTTLTTSGRPNSREHRTTVDSHLKIPVSQSADRSDSSSTVMSNGSQVPLTPNSVSVSVSAANTSSSLSSIVLGPSTETSTALAHGKTSSSSPTKTSPRARQAGTSSPTKPTETTQKTVPTNNGTGRGIRISNTAWKPEESKYGSWRTTEKEYKSIWGRNPEPTKDPTVSRARVGGLLAAPVSKPESVAPTTAGVVTSKSRRYAGIPQIHFGRWNSSRSGGIVSKQSQRFEQLVEAEALETSGGKALKPGESSQMASGSQRFKGSPLLGNSERYSTSFILNSSDGRLSPDTLYILKKHPELVRDDLFHSSSKSLDYSLGPPPELPGNFPDEYRTFSTRSEFSAGSQELSRNFREDFIIESSRKLDRPPSPGRNLPSEYLRDGQNGGVRSKSLREKSFIQSVAGRYPSGSIVPKSVTALKNPVEVRTSPTSGFKPASHHEPCINSCVGLALRTAGELDAEYSTATPSSARWVLLDGAVGSSANTGSMLANVGSASGNVGSMSTSNSGPTMGNSGPASMPAVASSSNTGGAAQPRGGRSHVTPSGSRTAQDTIEMAPQNDLKLAVPSALKTVQNGGTKTVQQTSVVPPAKSAAVYIDRRLEQVRMDDIDGMHRFRSEPQLPYGKDSPHIPPPRPTSSPPRESPSQPRTSMNRDTSIKNLVSCYENKAEEHKRRQSILTLRHREATGQNVSGLYGLPSPSFLQDSPDPLVMKSIGTSRTIQVMRCTGEGPDNQLAMFDSKMGVADSFEKKAKLLESKLAPGLVQLQAIRLAENNYSPTKLVPCSVRSSVTQTRTISLQDTVRPKYSMSSDRQLAGILTSGIGHSKRNGNTNNSVATEQYRSIATNTDVTNDNNQEEMDKSRVRELDEEYVMLYRQLSPVSVTSTVQSSHIEQFFLDDEFSSENVVGPSLGSHLDLQTTASRHQQTGSVDRHQQTGSVDLATSIDLGLPLSEATDMDVSLLGSETNSPMDRHQRTSTDQALTLTQEEVQRVIDAISDDDDSVSTVSSEASEMVARSIQLTKCVNNFPEQGYKSMVTVESDTTRGRHKVTCSKSDLSTGEQRTMYCAKMKGQRIVTNVILDQPTAPSGNNPDIDDEDDTRPIAV